MGSMDERSLGRFDHSGAFQMCLVFAPVLYTDIPAELRALDALNPQ